MAVMDLPISDSKIIVNENHRVAITIIHAPSRNLIVKNCLGTIFNCLDDDEVNDADADADEDDDDQDEDDETIFVEEGVQLLYDLHKRKLPRQFLHSFHHCLSETSTNKLSPVSTFSQVDMRD
jgi:hypothetical protein